MTLTTPEAAAPGVARSARRGSLGVLAGLAVLAATSYGVLVLSGRSLGPAGFSGVSALYVLLSALGTGLFLPAEQEVARLWADGVVRGRDPSAAAARVGLLAAGLALLVALLAETALRGPALRLMDGNPQLLGALVLGLTGYAACFVVRGVFAGTSRLDRYGVQLAAEGGSRFLGALPLVAWGAGPAAFGWIIGASPWFAALVTVPWRDVRRPRGPVPAWLPLMRSLGFIVCSVGASQILINAGPVVIQVLSAASQKAAAGGFLAALVVVRVPVFLFTAVQPSFLPALARHAGAARHQAFTALVRSLTLGLLGFAVATTALLVAVGPFVLRLAFGFSVGIDRLDFGLLSAASGLFLLASLWAQSLLAGDQHRDTLWGWVAGLIALGVATALPGAPVARAETGFVSGATVAAFVQAAVLIRSPLFRPEQPENDVLSDRD